MQKNMLLILKHDEKTYWSLGVLISELKNQMELLADIFSLYFSCPVCSEYLCNFFKTKK